MKRKERDEMAMIENVWAMIWLIVFMGAGALMMTIDWLVR